MRFASALFVALIASAAPAAAVVVETFEAAGPKDVALASLSTSVGVFNPIAPANNVWVASPGYNNFGPGLNPTTSSILTSNGDEGIELIFAFLSPHFEADVYLNDLGPATLTLFSGANIVGLFDFSADADSTNNLRSISLTFGGGVLMDRMTFVSTAGGRLNTGLDNVGITAVPEPATWAMMIGGFALAGAAMRRRTTRFSFA